MQHPIVRHAGLDWLRIGAFGLLILYHIGLYFGPWGWHIDAPRPVGWLIFPLLALNPWRMTLLFVVSGYAARALLARAEPGGFLWSRAVRLLVPLAFGVLVVVAPQPWVERMNAGTWHGGFLDYWLTDYLGGRDPGTPTLDNLWFVAYIWAYSVIVALAAWVLPARWQERAQDAFERAMRGRGLFVWPLLWLFAVRLVLFPTMMPTNRLLNDWNGHCVYLMAFLFGFALARAPGLLEGIHARTRTAGALAALGYAVMALQHLMLGAHDPAPGTAALALLRAGTALVNWSMIVLLLGLAERIKADRSRWRTTLNEAVFPSYIVHQTAIVLIAWALRPLAWGNLAQFAVILPGTVAACVAFYLLGTVAGPFRPLFGLAPAKVRRSSGQRAGVDPVPGPVTPGA